MGCGSRKPETIDWCIREFKKLSSGPFGIDLLLPVTMGTGAKTETKAEIRARLVKDYPKHVAFVQDLVKEYDLPEIDLEDSEEEAMTQDLLRKEFEVVLDHKVPVFVAGLGDPSWVVPLARAQGMKVGGVVGAVRHAQRQKEADVDFMVAQGTEGGGHTGKIGTMALVPQVVDAVKIPVVAAGSIIDGRGLAAALAFGAVGVWVGTRFIMSTEAHAHQDAKDHMLDASIEDTIITRSYTGKPCRCIQNDRIKRFEDNPDQTQSYEFFFCNKVIYIGKIKSKYWKRKTSV
jgi:NAD(P)H-dependent flavin oxidoreductase YrpB (nitropropane dioxygenase family)